MIGYAELKHLAAENAAVADEGKFAARGIDLDGFTEFEREAVESMIGLNADERAALGAMLHAGFELGYRVGVLGGS